MTKYKSHHYVPQMYMRLFARPGDNRVGVYVIDRGKFIRAAPIRGQACRDFFYGKDPRAEKAFGQVEGRAARIFTDIIERRRLPEPGSQEHEWLIFYLGIQHSRTVGAAEQYNEGAVKVVRSVLRRKLELEGNAEMMAALDKVKIKRTNAVSELVGYATIGASLLADLTFILLSNVSEADFVASDTPVVLHNRLYENQHISVTGYANIGLQLFLPLGPRLALFGFDGSVSDISSAAEGIVKIADPLQIQLINGLQWEAAEAVLLASPETPEAQFLAEASRWTGRRRSERTIFREEIVEHSDGEVRTRHGVGEVPSTVSLDLPFVEITCPPPSQLGEYELPPFRDQERVERVERAFDILGEIDELRRSG